MLEICYCTFADCVLSTQCKLLERNGSVKKINISQLRILICKWVGHAWAEVSADRKFMIDTFRKTGLALPIDGSKDHEMKFLDVENLEIPRIKSVLIAIL